MAVSEPIDPRVRLAISQWPEDTPRGAVSTFCAEHGISRKSFQGRSAATRHQQVLARPARRQPTSASPDAAADVDHAFKQVLVVTDGNQTDDKIIITDVDGEILAEHTRPTPGVTYVGNGRARGRRPKSSETSPKS